MAALPESRRNNSSINPLDLYSGLPSTSPVYHDLCEDSAAFTTSPVSAVVASCYAILIPLTVLGNGSVIAAFATNGRLRTATSFFIVGLAASDLLVGTFAVPFWTFVVSHDNIMAGYCFSTYAVYISFDVFAGCASILQLTSIALERFISAQWPLIHRKMPRRVYCAMIFVAWLSATVMAALQPLQARTPRWRETYTIFLFLTYFCFPLVIIVTCYCYIFKISRFQARRRLSSSSTRCGHTPGGAIKELNVAITVAVITILFIVAWLPFFVVTVIATFCLSCLPSPQGLLHLVKFLKFLQYSSSAVNPYIYAYRNTEMRRTLAKIASKFLPCDVGLARTRNIVGQSIMQGQAQERQQSISLRNVISSEERRVFDEKIQDKTPTKPPKKRKKKTVVIYL
ncbi:muscarinic acetylcholine receptor M3-like [Orbicella faveolata]|uniref:muscarinic acetylcholine receptor M3-like n=1 Tax=Orbicella faveolata TaxID=48498 RepID=UPI0009E1E87B|nr:muscarinic acetylcholine receptor M3-like [Orbicella faveolata]XP_020618886.1 muscarinic acetylcholine receptor M3-like [Orbicella faveolata]